MVNVMDDCTQLDSFEKIAAITGIDAQIIELNGKIYNNCYLFHADIVS
jgi:hypothetical protein